ncbi:MAG: DNA-3-methyladenine glycosylase I [Ardenticatenales bacterium]|nr:DNA-3-methyladenine glycosylase I [Ardenticatenales bacterium]
MHRCDWAKRESLIPYHDTEWGVPLRDDALLLEALVLGTFQAGLSWEVVLKKRPAFRHAFDHFAPALVAAYGPERVDTLLAEEGIIRNRRKVEAAIQNARACLAVQARYGSFAAYLWDFVDGVPLQNHWQHEAERPAQTPLSVTISRDMKQHEFSFVGPITVYAFMQAVGLINDHLVPCFRHAEVKAISGHS